ncbi:hypothetical protein [Actinomadura sp. HBU206391]|uniref:hypothetical protein n=1 Tax=Actinomadura sp. HBU206391 TaxID=2731692 RepID=UPI0016506119|nr:hypothetical protein [Actinomadura sp. HBU206391]
MGGRFGPKRLDADPQFELEMAVCDRYRIPHSEFLSWDEYDREKAIWWMVRERQRCRGCGTRPEEWDPEQGGHKDAYSAGTRMCPGCFHLETAREAGNGKQATGIHLVLKPRREVTGGTSAEHRP